MRAFLILPLSAALLGGCLTTQESPIYQQSSTYQGDPNARHQYATATTTAATYQTAPTPAPYVDPFSVVAREPAQAYSAPATVMASSPADPAYGAGYVTDTPDFTAVESASGTSVETYSTPSTVMAASPTDSLYGETEVSGTPGYMAIQQSLQAETSQAAVQPFTQTENVAPAPVTAAGTPIPYDYSRNMVYVDAVTTGQGLSETSRVLPQVGQGIGQSYTVQQGDTVYGLSRKTCVGVNVIQSMNGLSSDYAIQIGQSITLPASVC